MIKNMISDITLLLYAWISVLSFWYYRSRRPNNLKPQILLDKFFVILFKIIAIGWVISSIYLLFVGWTILMIPVAIFLLTKYLPNNKFYEQVENVCLVPIMLVYGIKHWSEIKRGIKKNKSKEHNALTKQTSALEVLTYLFMFLLIISLSEMFGITGMVEQFQSGHMKPSWAAVVMLMLLVNPYRVQVYIATIIVGSALLVLAIYQSWFKKK